MKRKGFLAGLGVGAAALAATAATAKAKPRENLRPGTWNFKAVCVNERCEMHGVKKDVPHQSVDGVMIAPGTMVCETCGHVMPAVGAKVIDQP